MWTSFEIRWRDAVLGAMLPASESIPGYGDLDTSGFWERYPTAAPPLLRLGFRTAIWTLALWCFARHRSSPGSVTMEDREKLLSDAANSRFFLLRQLVLVLKLIATMAAFRDPGLRKAADPLRLGPDP
jgi:hypothetical protein